MKKFNFHKTYEERTEALRTFKANDMDSRAECFDMLQEIIVDQGVGTRQVLEDLELDDLVNNAAFLNLSITEAIHEILDRVPSKDVRAYAATFKADDIALENKMAQDNLQSDLSSILQKAGIKASIEPRISEDGKVTLYAYTRKQMYRWEEKLEAMGFKVHAYPEQGAFLVKFSINPVKAQDAERPEKKIIEITEADEDRWEEIIRCFDAFKNKLDAQVREFLNDRDQQPEGALTLEDVEDVLYRYTVLAGKHAFDFEEDQVEEEVEVEEPEQEEVEAVEEEIPAEKEEDELEKLLSEE